MPYFDFTGEDYWVEDAPGGFITIGASNFELPSTVGIQSYSIIPREVYVDAGGSLIVDPYSGVVDGYTGGDPNATLWYQYYDPQEVRISMQPQGVDSGNYEASDIRIFTGTSLGSHSVNAVQTYDKTSQTYDIVLTPLALADYITLINFQFGLGQEMEITSLEFLADGAAPAEFWQQFIGTEETAT